MSYFDKEEAPVFKLGIDEVNAAYLKTATRWAKFIGIFFCLALIVGSVFAGVAFTLNPVVGALSTNQTVIIVVIVALLEFGINFYPVFSLIRFSNHIRKALETSSQEEFTKGLRSLKNFFLYIGVLLIAGVLIYVFAIGGMIINLLSTPAPL